MKKSYKYLLLLLLLLAACSPSIDTPNPPIRYSGVQPTEIPLDPFLHAPLTPLPDRFPAVARHPDPAEWPIRVVNQAPVNNPEAQNSPMSVDFRSRDLSNLDLTQSMTALANLDFDSHTIWPDPKMMPAGFDYDQIMELGKNPGLGIRRLHSLGITGYGIGIAIIDQTLLVDHQEYADQLRLYEEMDIKGGWLEPQMHGAAVASIAVGRTVGVAPDADLYYIATPCGETDDYSCRAKAVYRVLEINRELPPDRKIRVISMSIGWGPDSKGYDEIMAATKAARQAGLLVVCSSISYVHGFHLNGLGRSPLLDPESVFSYTPGLFWIDYFYSGQEMPVALMAPMDSRTVASPIGVSDYEFLREGGWSWAIPYIAGVYALAVQVKPSITPDEFWSQALATGQTIIIQQDGKDYNLGVILNPPALIASLQDD